MPAACAASQCMLREKPKSWVTKSTAMPHACFLTGKQPYDPKSATASGHHNGYRSIGTTQPYTLETPPASMAAL